MIPPTTLVELLINRAQHQPDKRAYTFLKEGKIEGGSLTYAQLEKRVQAIAAKLQSLSTLGERALLLYPSGLDYIAAFLGCLYAGIVAVPTYPPRRNRSDQRLQAIATDAQATLILTTADILSNQAQRLSYTPGLKNLHWLATDTLTEELAEHWQSPHIHRDTLAFLQYTSGSTGTPKGVMVSHGNLLHNSAYMATIWQCHSESIMVTWLPIFHDMGLIFGILQPLYQGFPCYLMSPTTFVQHPFRWLDAISRYQATHSGAPNFAYELCVNKITKEQRASLDLSHWQMSLNGAEPVRADTFRRFYEYFQPSGLKPTTLCHGYGLAEATLVVAGAKQSDLPVYYPIQSVALEQDRAQVASINESHTQTLVGCGHLALDAKIVIANPKTSMLCQANEIGEIWLASPSVAHGYWQRPLETAETFQAYLANTGEGPFLRTGDLGFVREDGELFVTGRIKDVIIIRGGNHYPQDIELTVEQSHTALRASGAAAFSVGVAGEERLVVVQEVERTALKQLKENEIINAIRQAISEQHDLQIYAVLLLKPATLPKTSSGKVQRGACRKGFLESTLNTIAIWQQDISSTTPTAPQQNHDFRTVTIETLQTWLLTKLSQHLKIALSEINIQEPFASYGIDSMTAVSLSGELETWLGRALSPTLVYDYPTIQALSHHLAGEPYCFPPKTATVLEPTKFNEAIAIIGLCCRLPGAENPQAFWQLLRNGKDAISQVPASRWNKNACQINTRWGGFLEQVAEFDSHFFGISPKEAQQMDPQQRLLLEVSWEALEDASIAPDNLAGTQTGIFIGISTDDYANLQLKSGITPDIYSQTGNAFSIAANRLSYLLDLRGASVAIDTACSSSLVAVHHACQSLRLGECHLALAGGVNLILNPDLTMSFSQAGMMAADGRCKTFDASADGYVRGEGCGMIVLKRLSEAIQDNDNILAIIKGSAINQDGRTNGLTAPNGIAQQAVIRQALQNAGIAPAQISYVETHGTGTSLGDPIEVNALKEILLEGRSPEQPCWIGSVKTNIGHLEAAAGIAGLIKVVLSLQHQEIFPHLHFQQLNPLIDIVDTPVKIPTQLGEWRVGNGGRRMAGVSSYGFGGTNAHIVLEQASKAAQTFKVFSPERPKHLFTLSAKTDSALRELVQRYETYLSCYPEMPVTDICYTVNTGRSHFAHRLAIIAESTEQLRESLKKYEAEFWDSNPNSGVQSFSISSQKLFKPDRFSKPVRFFSGNRQPPKIAFLLTGQGSQYIGMGQQLYETQPTFRQILERCDEILRPYLEIPLLKILYPEIHHPKLEETIYTQPVLFALEYALAELWQSWGIKPSIVMGHSIGEYVAACVAGVFSLEEGLKLIAERARLMQSLPQDGEMVAVFADVNTVAEAIYLNSQTVSIAALNEPQNTVISGKRTAIQTVVRNLEAMGIETRKLSVSHAFHSPLMEPILEAFEQVASQVSFQKPRIPLISNVTGQVLEQVPDAKYWRQHSRETVQFMPSIKTLFDLGYVHFLEMGPKPVLSHLGQGCQPKTTSATWLSSLNPKQTDWQVLLTSLSTLYVQGAEVNWKEFDKYYPRRRISLPTYPFQRKYYWINQQNSNRQPNQSELPPTTTENTKSKGKTTLSASNLEQILTQQVQAASQAVSQVTAETVSQVASQQLSFLQKRSIFS